MNLHSIKTRSRFASSQVSGLRSRDNTTQPGDGGFLPPHGLTLQQSSLGTSRLRCGATTKQARQKKTQTSANGYTRCSARLRGKNKEKQTCRIWPNSNFGGLARSGKHRCFNRRRTEERSIFIGGRGGSDRPVCEVLFDFVAVGGRRMWRSKKSSAPLFCFAGPRCDVPFHGEEHTYCTTLPQQQMLLQQQYVGRKRSSGTTYTIQSRVGRQSFPSGRRF